MIIIIQAIHEHLRYFIKKKELNKKNYKKDNYYYSFRKFKKLVKKILFLNKLQN